ncbi:hypothetical protein CXF86_11030 [Shewanella sp. GutCb]|uniref:hypothetical protein n=1 Tax=Shewanella sp. GutCb TaxID=2058315 RepID=UPI000C797E0E|nr:hypothetical protein [Shewanella sp. GutCb]PKG74816.1 hypothetical protein CXF86_11030 [Shewanella sp. GutCb]
MQDAALDSAAVLGGKPAFDLWLKGKDVWNNWVESNIDATVDFSYMDFSADELNLDSKVISFDGFIFPKGKTLFNGSLFYSAKLSFIDAIFYGVACFDGAHFPKGEVSFNGTVFHEDACFSLAVFDKGEVSFNNTKFLGLKVCFDGASFDEGDVSFRNTEFTNSSVTFVNANFDTGNIVFEDISNSNNISFKNANFGGGDFLFESNKVTNNLNFNHAIFGCGGVYIRDCVFNGEVDFTEVDFGKGDFELSHIDCYFGLDLSYSTFERGNIMLSFIDLKNGPLLSDNAIFGDGIFSLENLSVNGSYISFCDSTFGDGRAEFMNLKMNSSTVDFSNVHFKSSVEFSQLYSNKQCLIGLNASIFEKSLQIHDWDNCIPDLTSSKTSSHLSLNDVYFKLQRSGDWIKRSTDKNDASRIRRLKEISEINKDHQSALRFNADEMRAKRWNSFGFFRSILDMIFSITSNYGQSIFRPLAFLILLMFSTSSIIVFTSGLTWPNLGCSIELVTANTLPFIAISKDVRVHSIENLFSGSLLPEYFNLLMMSHGFFSFVFLFLIGLGVRNLFRI